MTDLQKYTELKEKYKNQIPVPVVIIARELGLHVYETDELSENVSGVLKKENNNFLILLNERQPAWRKRFTIAHKIGHFLKHKASLNDGLQYVDNVKQPALELRLVDNARMTEEQRKEEQEASEIAYELLMPEELFLPAYENATDISEIAKRFNVSESIATVRALELTNSYTI